MKNVIFGLMLGLLLGCATIGAYQAAIFVQCWQLHSMQYCSDHIWYNE